MAALSKSVHNVNCHIFSLLEWTFFYDFVNYTIFQSDLAVFSKTDVKFVIVKNYQLSPPISCWKLSQWWIYIVNLRHMHPTTPVGSIFYIFLQFLATLAQIIGCAPFGIGVPARTPRLGNPRSAALSAKICTRKNDLVTYINGT